MVFRVFHVKQVPSDWLLTCRHPGRTASGPVTVSRGKAKILAWAWNRSDEEHHLRQPARVEVGFSGPLPTVLPEPRPPQTLIPTLNGYLHLKPKLPPTGKSPRKRKTVAITLMSDGHRFCDWKSGPPKIPGARGPLRLSRFSRSTCYDRTSANSFSKNCFGLAPMTVFFTSPPWNR